MNNTFKDEDKERVIDFLNFVAKNAKFELNTQDVINYFKLLTYMQKTLIPKIEDNIFEIKKINNPKKDK